MTTPKSASTAAHSTQARVIASAASQAARSIANATTKTKNALLQLFIDNLSHNIKSIITANNRDMAAAGDLSEALKDRLLLDEKRLRNMIDSIGAVLSLPDPIGEMSDFCIRPSGIQVGKMRVPLGVILAIYESRPNVTADIAVLALKTGNASILRGGGEAQHSNTAIGVCLSNALEAAGLPATTAQVITTGGRSMVEALLACHEEIDLVIPRGGRGLIERVTTCARMPVLKHMDGNCHVYVDAAANLSMAQSIVINAKTRRYGVCNAAESMLVHRQIAGTFLPQIAAALLQYGVELRGCAATQALIGGDRCRAATEQDWHTEYLAPIISIKIVTDIDEAIAHINRFGSAHSDAIISDSVEASDRFLREVDSSSVLLNASTAFADGGEYGLGAEVGISTGKFHARGPVGLAGLTCQKYIVLGSGNIRK